jgi:phenylacetic acid degradation operon negative regulatory protein
MVEAAYHSLRGHRILRLLIDNFRNRNIEIMKPTAKSLILDLLASVKQGSMPVRALVEAGALFGIAENNVRVALARAYTANLVVRDERGAYRLGERSEALSRRTVGWRDLTSQVRAWDGHWVAVLVGSAASRSAGRPQTDTSRRRHQQALDVLGFRNLEPGLAVRPDNLEGGVATIRDRLVRLELPSTAPHGARVGPLVFGIRDLDPMADLRARNLWDAAVLVEAYENSRREIHASEARIQTMTTADAMVESFLIGGTVLRQIVFDPLLPDAIVPSSARTALVTTMESYEDLARRSWSEFLERFGATELRPPVNLRGLSADGDPDGLTAERRTENESNES